MFHFVGISTVLSLKIMCTHVRQNFWKVSSNSKHHRKPTMNINSQHLLGNQISAKSEDFCIWWPFCTLVTMATAAILNFFNPPPKLPHTTVDISFFLPPKVYPTHFSATTERKSMKLHRNVKHYNMSLKLCLGDIIIGDMWLDVILQ
jgi:hypothetical protein